MKVILISNNFPYGGAAANLLRNFSIGLSRQNIPIKVIIPGGNSYGNKKGLNNYRTGIIEGVPYQHLGFLNHPKNYIGKLVDNLCVYILPVFYLAKAALKDNVDIIITYGTTFWLTGIYVILTKMFRIKLVIILPEFFEKPFNKKFSYELIKWYSFYAGIRYMVKYADGFIVLSTYLRDYLRNKLRTTKEIFIMPNLTNPDLFDLQDIEPLFHDKTTIGFTGVLTRKDGALDLIKSFSVLNNKYPDTHLLIIGDNTNGTTVIPRHRAYAKELNVDQSITFAGLTEYEKIPKLLNSCQILTLIRPNGVFAEAGFPTKLGEYFACRKPVVITRVGDIPKYFTDEEHVILVDPENIDSIVDGFERLLNNRELAPRLSKNAYAWMDANLNYKNVSVRIAKFLSSI
jgi:glycosyltransferase involved in cell wall biosynthesis